MGSAPGERALALFAAVAVGALAGLGGFAVWYGDGLAYLRDDPTACANCHVMQEHFDAWTRSSHRAVATCNDCHLRHDFVGGWVTKADNGFFHSVAFTTGSYPDPIRIKPRNRRVTQSTCVACHGDFVHPQLALSNGDDGLWCAGCHGAVGHAQR